VVNVFGTKMENVNVILKMGDLKKWDSLGHIRLMLAVEEEFKIKFITEEIFKLTNLGMIQKYLVEKGKI